MSRWEFMRRLEELLLDISPNEREEALQYYNDYFNDAGKENEKEVIGALGSPEQVAKIVKDGLGDNGGQGEFTENGFVSGSSHTQNEIMKRPQDGSAKGNSDDSVKKESDTAAYASDNASYGQDGAQNSENCSQGSDTFGHNDDPFGQSYGTYSANDNIYNKGQDGSDGKEGKEGLPTWAVVLIVIGGILVSPALLGIIGAAFALAVSVIAAAAGLVFGFGLAMVILYIVGLSLVIAGFGCMFTYPLTGIGLIGGGFLCGALGILFMLLTGFLAGKCIPGIFQGISYICKKLFGNKGGSKA